MDSQKINENESPNDSDAIINRPELKNISLIRLKMIDSPISNRPRTVYFENDPSLNKIIQNEHHIPKPFVLPDIKYAVVYKAYKNLPLCLSGPMAYNNIIRTKNFEQANIIWKLLKPDKMYPLLRRLNHYQRFNHFPMTWQLSRKDNLYSNYKKLRDQFPNDYHYLPESYIMPKDLELIKPKLMNYQMTIDNLWLLKPVASSRGRGIRLMINPETIPSKVLITKYIQNPHLINNKKYDLRLYLLITGYSPLKIYLYQEGLVRFASEDYDLNSSNMSNRYIHLTNYSVNKNSLKYNINVEIDGENGSKWSLSTLRHYFKENNLKFEPVWEKIKDIMIKTILTVTDEAIPCIKSFNVTSNNLFELYGVDILLDDKLNPWLMECNLNPSLNCDTDLDLKIKSKLLTDIFNIIGIIPYSHTKKSEILDTEIASNLISTTLLETNEEFQRPIGSYERIFPLKSNVDYYAQFLKSPGEINKTVWENLKKQQSKKNE